MSPVRNNSKKTVTTSVSKTQKTGVSNGMSFVLYPRATEKAYASATNLNTYVFNVPLTANKIEVKKLVESQYSVTVEAVNMVRMTGKAVNRAVNNRGTRTRGKRNDFKKAYVVVAKGQTIPVFATSEEGEDK